MATARTAVEEQASRMGLAVVGERLSPANGGVLFDLSDGSTMDIYGTDSYPREGCNVAIDVLKDGYSVGVFTPQGKLTESTFCDTADELSAMIKRWCDGGPMSRREGVKL